MAATARKAVKDVFPDMPVYCSGLQGEPSFWVLISNYLSEGKNQKALDLYNKFDPYDKLQIYNDIQKLTDYTNTKVKSPDCVWLRQALTSSLYNTDAVPAYENLPLDGLNVPARLW